MTKSKGRASAKPRSGTKSRSKGKRAKSRPSGTTITAIMESTGWQAHTVRGFLAAVVRKKLGLNLESDKTDGERVYRVVGMPDEGTEPEAA
jgi:hypothetical protein